MSSNSSSFFCHSSPVGTRATPSFEQNVRQLLSVLFEFLHSSTMSPGYADQPSTISDANSRGTQVKPAYLTWFLFGI
eukprot:c19597_g1_i1 orf=325-555(+)